MSKSARTLFFLNIAALLGLSVWFRVVHLDRIPGVGGDDAWVTMQIRQFWSNQDFTFITPTHRLVSPTYTLVVALFQMFPVTNFWWLKLPTLLAGLALPPLFYFLFRRFFSRDLLLSLTALVAASPFLIAYSRAMGEMSQLPLAVTVVLWCLLARHIGWTVVAFLWALTIHPSVIFLFPTLLAFFIHFWREDTIRLRPRTLLFACCAVLGLVTWQIWIYPYDYGAILRSVYISATQPQVTRGFLVGLSRVFSGLSAIQDFAGPLALPVAGVVDALTLAFLAGVFFLARRTGVLFWGLILSFVVQYFISGMSTVETGRERFSIYLTVPLVVLIGLAAKRFPKIAPWFLILIAWLQLGLFQMSYFESFHQTGGSPGFSYRTGAREPKQTIFEWIQKDKNIFSWRSNRIVTENWSYYWPLAYLDSPKKNFEIFTVDHESFGRNFDRLISGPSNIDAEFRNGAYFVGTPGGVLSEFLETFPTDQILKFEALDSSGQPVLSVFRLRN